MKSLCAMALVCCILAGCNRASQNQEAVRQGVIEYVATKVNVSAMDVAVTAVSFKGQEADATVSFTAKGAPPGSGLEMQYTLEQKSGKWVVKNSAEAGSPHGAAATAPGQMGMPPGHPPLDSPEAKK